VGSRELESPTSSVSRKRSNQLSYEPENTITAANDSELNAPYMDATELFRSLEEFNMTALHQERVIETARTRQPCFTSKALSPCNELVQLWDLLLYTSPGSLKSELYKPIGRRQGTILNLWPAKERDSPRPRLLLMDTVPGTVVNVL
jgi:hypothetical protein